MYDETPVHSPGRELPRLRLRQEELPEVMTWEVNGKYYIVLKVEMVAKNNAKIHGVEESNDKVKIEGSFQVLAVKALGDKPIDAKTLEREDFEKTVAKARTSKI